MPISKELVGRWLGISILVMVLLSPSFVYAKGDVSTHERTLPLRSDLLEGHPIVHTAHWTVPQQTWRAGKWESLTLPQQYAATDRVQYYVELWDADNRPIPGFLSRPLATNVISGLDVIDMSVHGSIRVVLFQLADTVAPPELGVAHITYTEQFNSRLLLVLIALTFVYLLIIVAAIRFRIGPRTFATTFKEVLHWNPGSANTHRMACLSLVIILCAGIFSFSLGTYAGGLQPVYLFLKLPFVFFCAILLGFSLLYVLSLLLGVGTTVLDLFHRTLAVFALISVVLASSSPLVWFQVFVGKGHDHLLLVVLVAAALSFLVGCAKLIGFFRERGSRQPFLLIGVWALVIGILILQLTWLFRPWVGLLDPVESSLPFSRLAGGNVFVQLGATIERLSN